MKRASLAAGLLLAVALLAPGQAAAAGEGQHVLIETLGSANQASFAEPKGLAVDQGSGEIYAIDGRSEKQKITVSATGGQFKLKFGALETGDLAFDVNSEPLQVALRNAFCGGAPCVSVLSGKGNAAGTNPYEILFVTTLATTAVEEFVCLPGTTPLSGGSGCAVETTTNGVDGTISRWNADGTQSEFSGLGSNAIDGKGPGVDQTPQVGLHFANATLSQVAVDESGGETDGDIYAVQFFAHLVDVFSPSGGYLGQLTQFKEGPAAEGSFKDIQPTGIGVDPGGDVYVADPNATIHKYDPAADPVANADNVANITLANPLQLAAGAGPTAGHLFAVEFSTGKAFKLDATTGAVQYGGTPIAAGATTVTVDPLTGYLYLAKNSEVLVYDASGPTEATLLESIPVASSVTGIAVDGGTKRLYVAREGSPKIDVYAVLVIPQVQTGAASEVKKTTATVDGTLNPEGVPVTECLFEYGKTASYGQSAPCDALDGAPISGAGEIPADEATHSISADISGLEPNTIYHYRLVAENATAPGKGEDETFQTLGPPLIKAESVPAIGTSEATIAAEIDPRGEATEAAVEYVSEAEFDESGYAEASISEAEEIGDGIGFIDFSQEITGLEPDTTYHFRVLANNQVDPPVHGEDKTLTTFALPGGLPDGRAWEQVTPPFKAGEPFSLEPGPRTGLGGTCDSCTPGWDKERFPMQASPDGDAIAYEGNPFAAGIAAGANQYVSRRGAGGWQTTSLSKATYRDDASAREGFKALSPDLSRAILMQSTPALSPEATEGFANLYIQDEGKAALTTLISAEPPNRSPETNGPDAFLVNYAGANAGSEAAPAFSHVIFQANDSLSAEDPGIAPEAPAVETGERNLYEWSGGRLHLVNVLPGNGEAAADAVIGSGVLLEAAGKAANFDFDHAISDDGSRVFWSAVPSGQVYVRENAESTIQIPDPGKFLTAAPDGSRVLLSNGHIYGLEDESTTDLTAGQGGFQGILGASEDLSRVYFVDNQALSPPEEENANGEHAEAGKPNLYLSDDGALSFIATLAPGDDVAGDGGELGTWHAAAGNRLAQVSADGRWLAFESRASLSGYDSTIAEAAGCVGIVKTGIPQCFEVFAYDAQEDALACASCNPLGRRPLGNSNLALIFGGQEFFSERPDNLPDQGEGRLFFESQDALSAADTNGHIQDVYEWQPEGVGGCGRASGCITLISGGHSPNDSYFLDSTPSGKDAFFITRAALVPQDIDDFLDVYDARVGGGIPEVLNPPCEGEACKGAALHAPEEKTPATAGFSAPGNQRQRSCAKGKVRRGTRCVKRTRRHHGKRSNRSAQMHDRGGSR